LKYITEKRKIKNKKEKRKRKRKRKLNKNYKKIAKIRGTEL
jgi:hypothetical protein